MNNTTANNHGMQGLNSIRIKLHEQTDDLH